MFKDLLWPGVNFIESRGNRHLFTSLNYKNSIFQNYINISQKAYLLHRTFAWHRTIWIGWWRPMLRSQICIKHFLVYKHLILSSFSCRCFLLWRFLCSLNSFQACIYMFRSTRQKTLDESETVLNLASAKTLSCGMLVNLC